MKQRTYIAIDLKSFYASVECRERGLDPLDTNLVVADESRSDKTICLAVTPSLKSYGISGRGRLFEVKQRVKEANAGRQHDAPGHRLEGSSHFFSELQANPSLAIDFVIAPPRMAYYMEYSTRIYQVYLKYIAPEDIVVYSIDEVFMLSLIHIFEELCPPELRFTDDADGPWEWKLSLIHISTGQGQAASVPLIISAKTYFLI